MLCRLLLPVVLCTALIGHDAAAKSGRTVAAPTQDETIAVIFSEIEKRIIKEYFGAGDDRSGYGGKSKGKGKGKGDKSMPRGLAKRDSMTPGHAKQLERNGTLPPGLQKRFLPSALNGKLGPPPKGTERVIVGNDAVLLRKGTNLILDVLENVILNGG